MDPGNQAVVDFAVKNNGPSDAASPITVKEHVVEAGVTFVSERTRGRTCSAAGQAVECPGPRWLPVGASVPGASLCPGEYARLMDRHGRPGSPLN